MLLILIIKLIRIQLLLSLIEQIQLQTKNPNIQSKFKPFIILLQSIFIILESLLIVMHLDITVPDLPYNIISTSIKGYSSSEGFHRVFWLLYF